LKSRPTTFQEEKKTMTSRARLFLVLITVCTTAWACDDDVPTAGSGLGRDTNHATGGSDAGSTAGSSGDVDDRTEDDIVPGTASVQFRNRYSSRSIIGLFIAAANQRDWGDNLLTQTVPPGYGVTESGVPCKQKLDVMVVMTGNQQIKLPPFMFACDKVTGFDLEE
jgi:hypothetical protein